ELSNVGDYEQAELIKEFVEEELVPGNISSEVKFDQAFKQWKDDKKKKVIYEISEEWGVDSQIFEKAVDAYSKVKPEDIPYIRDLTSNVDYSSAKSRHYLLNLGYKEYLQVLLLNKHRLLFQSKT